MSSASNFDIVHLAQTQNETSLIPWVQQMRRLRLQSLQTDAGSFISQYKDEVDQPTKFWLDRLRDDNAHHFIGTTTREAQQRHDVTSSTWIAFLVLVSSEDTRLEQSESNNTLQRDLVVKNYHMAAVYVDPIFRGQGVCTKLIEAAICWVQEQVQSTNSAFSHITTTVRKENESAKRLYMKLGFAPWKEHSKQEGEEEQFLSDSLQLKVST